MADTSNVNRKHGIIVAGSRVGLLVFESKRRDREGDSGRYRQLAKALLPRRGTGGDALRRGAGTYWEG
jgi:hypothetical protein